MEYAQNLPEDFALSCLLITLKPHAIKSTLTLFNLFNCLVKLLLLPSLAEYGVVSLIYPLELVWDVQFVLLY